MLHDKIVSNIQEVRARGARTIVIAEEGDEAVVPYADHLIHVPRTPTLLARWSPRCRCRCSPARSPRPAATTSTSPATWPSRSPSSRSLAVTTYVALLRAVNLGSRQEAAPCPTCAGCSPTGGYADVQTYLQSGNAVFTAWTGPARSRSRPRSRTGSPATSA